MSVSFDLRFDLALNSDIDIAGPNLFSLILFQYSLWSDTLKKITQLFYTLLSFKHKHF